MDEERIGKVEETKENGRTEVRETKKEGLELRR